MRKKKSLHKNISLYKIYESKLAELKTGANRAYEKYDISEAIAKQARKKLVKVFQDMKI